MIICSNCGATNAEEDGSFCRKCGAPLPVSKRSTRINLTSIPGIRRQEKQAKKEAEEKKNSSDNQKSPQEHVPRNSNPNAEVRFFSANQNNHLDNKGRSNSDQRDLQAIPQTSHEQQQPQNRQPTSSSETISQQSQNAQPQMDTQQPQNSNQLPNDFLREITPQPFNEPVIQRREVYGPPRQQRSQEDSRNPSKSKPEIKQIPNRGAHQSQKSSSATQNINQSSLTGSPTTPTTSNSSTSSPSQHSSLAPPSRQRQKEIEQDMQDVLELLSKKLVVPKPREKKDPEEPDKNVEAKDELPPTSMNEILKNLFKIDLNIEASAIVKDDGTILASAISNRVSDTLFATIGQTLSMIGTDIVEGLNAGTLKTISLKATKGILDLAPINSKFEMTEGMFLILFSQPRVKSGVINIAVNSAKKQIKKYLGLKDNINE